MKTNAVFALRHAVLLLAAFTFATTAARAQTIPNPSFEANSLTVFPGYTFTAGNGAISGWSMVGSGGLNPASGNPFADNGAVPQGSNVAFVQSVNLPGDYNNGVSGLATIITGLTNGVSYKVSFRANSRTSSFYGAPAADWSLNNAEFVPFTAAPSVGGANAYYTVTGTFTATGSIAALSIRNQTAAVGGPADTTVLVDAFTIAVVPPVVTNTNDSGPGSLRQMLAYAATIPGANTVTFDPSLSGATIVLGSEIVIDDAASVTIDASSLPGGLTIDGGAGTNRLFSVSSGKNLALLGLTLTGGNGGGAFQNGNGGAIVNSGTLGLTRCTLSGNSVSSGSGGAILNYGMLTLTHSTFSGNDAIGVGGAIYHATGTATLAQCTLSGNVVGGNGGAIYNDTGTLTLTHCTLSGNDAGLGGAIFNNLPPATLTLTNSIVAGNTATGGPDIRNNGTITPTGVNFIGDPAGSGRSANGTLLTTASIGPINLGPLAIGGGPTRTMIPNRNSPAIDRASFIAGLTTDQRGFPRPVENGPSGEVPDLGAVELQITVVTTAADQLDVPAGAQTSLREAVRDGADFILFHPALSGATITLTTALGGEIVPGKSVTIDATSLPAGLTIDGGAGTNRIFTVSSGKSVALLGLTLTGGNGGGATQPGNGGAIVNSGTLALTRCTLSGNGGDNGGAILNDGGTLALTQCTLVGNSATTGGAILQTAGTQTLTQCTLVGNHSISGTGSAFYCQGGTLSLKHCTITGNLADAYAALLFESATTVTLTNCIVAGNTNGPLIGFPTDVYGGVPVNPTGVNFIGDLYGSGLTASTSILTTADNGSINLAPLGNYGGPTQTIALQPGSPALNAATGSTITSDQRGFPIVNTPDLGAYEAGTFTNYNAYIWESLPVTANALQHASGVDFDGDGVTNGNEWLALTDAANPSNYLRITQVVLSGSDILLTFPTVVGRTYSFEFNLNLATGTWTPLGFTRIGDGEIQTIPIGPVTGQSQLFFRIRVGP